MDLQDLANTLISDPEFGSGADLSGAAAEWHFWESVAFTIDSKDRFYDRQRRFSARIHNGTIDIEVPNAPGWRRRITDIKLSSDGRVNDYFINGISLESRMRRITDESGRIQGALRILGDVSVCLLADRAKAGEAHWKKRPQFVNLRIDGLSATALVGGVCRATFDRNQITSVFGMIHLKGRDPTTLLSSPVEVSRAQLEGIESLEVTPEHGDVLHLRPFD
jgi:hypothetical protein